MPVVNTVARGLREGALFILAALAVYLFVALVSYDGTDPGWSHTNGGQPVHNAGGVAGAWFADVALYLFGYLAYLFPVIVAYSGWMAYRGRQDRIVSSTLASVSLIVAGFAAAVASGTGLASLHFQASPAIMPASAGGILGDVIAVSLTRLFSPVGATLFMCALFFTGITLFTGVSWFRIMDITGDWVLRAFAWGQAGWRRAMELRADRAAHEEHAQKAAAVRRKKPEKKAPRIEPVLRQVEESERVKRDRQAPLFTPGPQDSSLPSLALLDAAEVSEGSISQESLEAMSRLVEMKLADFGVQVQVESVCPGPVITRFELRPAAGVKVSQISNLAKDLARALSAISVRVVEVIPGKPVVGLEIPNERRATVRLSEILQSKDYDTLGSPLALGLGKNISGHPVVADLARMPHLLVAGTTGSGKSVAINAMVLSLVYNATPNDVRLIMIDPKMLELSVYDGIPHLLAPVVTDMKEAANALRWCVAEMERRYALMAVLGVRNIGGYNKRVKEALDHGQPLPDPLAPPPLDGEPPVLQPFPYIVVIVDEFADMMMVVGKKVEELITRLAQKARAAGVHLILATQRPSVDVITGLIKANIPSRIAFQVSSKVDSRTILDQTGAEQLLGHGDMLWLSSGSSLPMRVHGAFVADHEVHNVVKDLKSRGQPQYLEEVFQDADNGGDTNDGGGSSDMESDPLYDQAVRIVTESRRASVSGIQRRLKIGYNRAARMVEAMEYAGIVGPLQSNGSREVLAPPPPER